MDTTSIKHLGNNDGYTLEMFVSFSLDSSKCAYSFKMSFHFQNVLSFSKCLMGTSFSMLLRNKNYKSFILFDEYAAKLVGFPIFK